ncbi:MAG: rhodanese-like domain-containing protein [Bordetella sp.]|uniref:rhodanese-like domain-containing protein n=1 Tax=Bordetella sp. TaxID=28081 RepID=UPI003F7B4729
MKKRFLLAGLHAAALMFALSTGAAHAQDANGYADEFRDFGVLATSYPKMNHYGEPTPTSIPGGKVVSTDQLAQMLEGNPKPGVFVAYAAKKTVPGAVVMDGAGEGRLLGTDMDRFSKALDSQTGGDKTRPIVFYCHSSRCWLSYNASLHAIKLGYTNVYWYRGGRDAWKAAKKRFVAPSGRW